jgi:DNA-directed RNA polymerase subunit RPC12/RpoP
MRSLSHIDCPHCGTRHFSLDRSRKFDRCSDCGRPLPSAEDLAKKQERAAWAKRMLPPFKAPKLKTAQRRAGHAKN